MKFIIVIGALSSFGQFVLFGITVWRSHFKNIPMTVVWETNPKNEGTPGSNESGKSN